MTEEREVAIVGAGPVGLCAALNLRLRGIDAVALEAAESPAEGSRAICFSKRTLEIFHKLGAAAPMVEKGARWSRGKIHFGDALIHEFDLLPESGHSMPAFVNLQQYYCERFLEARLCETDPQALRRGWRAVAVSQEKNKGGEGGEGGKEGKGGEGVEGVEGGGVLLEAECGGERKKLRARYLLACDGAKSDIRRMLGLKFQGDVFRERFLIADIRMLSDFPAERRFWFDPPFHRGGSALLHKQPDNIWRVDLQLGWHADPDEERKPENVVPRVRAMLGDDAKFELEWVSVYAFQSRRLKNFARGDVFFAGDSAHQVSPFGARGANSGVEDADNICWKLQMALRRGSPRALLDTYDPERTAAADENMRHTSRSTNFIAPQSDAAQAFRDAALDLAKTHPFARAIVNSGRLSTAAFLKNSPLNAEDDDAEGPKPGAVLPDAPLEKRGAKTWMLNELDGGFNVVRFARDDADAKVSESDFKKAAGDLPVRLHTIAPEWLYDAEGLLRKRLAADAGGWFLARPDGHLCARQRTGGTDKRDGRIGRGGVGGWADECAGVVRRILETGGAR